MALAGAPPAVAVKPRSATRRFALTGLALLVVPCAVAPLGYARMFSGFQPYDDEGMFLVALRDYLAGHPLMTPHLPLYGPFYFEVYAALFKLAGVSPTHDSGRWVTLAMWLLTIAVGGVVAHRLTGRLWLALGAQLAVFVGLIRLGNEPTSTYALSMLLLLTLSWLATASPRRRRSTAALMGATVAALFLTKVNVGVFAAVAVALGWAAGMRPRPRAYLLPVAAAIATAFPLIVTWSLIRQAWVLELGLVVSLSVLAVAVTAIAPASRSVRPSSVAGLLAGAGAVTVVCLGVALVGGSRPADMLDFLLVFPLRFPTVFTYPIEINAAVVAWAVVMVAAAFAAARVGEVPAGLRIAAGLFTWASVLLVPSSVFLLALPLLWLACRAPCGDASGGPDAYARLLIPALAVAEALQAYPVAGTQVSLAAVGMVPAGAIMLRDGLAQLRGSTAWLVALPAAVNLAAAAATGLTILTSFDAAEPLRLPGAESVRVDPSQAATLRAIVGSVSAHDCTFVVTYPGMGSMYLWTGRESSTEMRYVLWYVTLTADEQAALARQLRDRSGVCVIKNQRLIDFWTSGRPPPSGPLVDFIDSSFVRASSDGDYDLLVRAGS